MLGAIIGDIAGSRFEFDNHRSKEFDLFTDKCFATDDSIMTLAVAKAIMETARSAGSGVVHDDAFYSVLGGMTVKYMRGIGQRYPHCGYGGRFHGWMFSRNPEPYNSFGNGAAMRISPAGLAARTLSDVRRMSGAVTAVTHNHPEGIKGAEATAVAVYLARDGAPLEEIREAIVRDYYPLDFTIDGIRETYRFNETCQETVPQAIEAVLESTSFEDAIRTAISVGGDSDTLAAITGGIAEAYYGIPPDLRKRALRFLDGDLRAIYDEWAAFTAEDGAIPRFRPLTRYIETLSKVESFGGWIGGEQGDGTPGNPMRMPVMGYQPAAMEFVEEFYRFAAKHPEFGLNDYRAILEKYGVDWGFDGMRGADVHALDSRCVLAMIMTVIRVDRFCEGVLSSAFEEKMIGKWLERLKEIDEASSL
jgi:ADP-ribosylglycohydrolase